MFGIKISVFLADIFLLVLFLEKITGHHNEINH